MKANANQAGYLGADQGPFQCANCTHFDGQSQCELVDGMIEPQGCCNLFDSASAGQDQDQDNDNDNDQDNAPLAQQAANAMNAQQPAQQAGNIGGPGKRNTFAGMMQR